MKRVIVDYKKLTNEILSMLVDKYPDGYSDDDIIRFKNAKNETIEALEVRTEDTIYLVKVSTRLATSMENFDEEEDYSVEDDIHNDTLEIPDADKKKSEQEKLPEQEHDSHEEDEDDDYDHYHDHDEDDDYPQYQEYDEDEDE
ncbi:DNA primase [Capnocytophaga catalasegens]|uniref:DNA primase n=1 Tax=Capnocytophaga catalasegens TaxID=1004260 RepID=A0AAV5AVJ7_9FLAO|nr:DNA primase [Capnocytophaga catalasegens]GIZ16229.1 hypothetical protein RCZ03_22290 [Capnocytophaga catalasegens]GJM49457.1 hypothetical protein RCZ15_04320 [Capnocytophaga catalasegens]GJM53637.1 hypothetical protein RCZ16_19530 [Capnocytophaga catalasegens]